PLVESSHYLDGYNCQAWVNLFRIAGLTDSAISVHGKFGLAYLCAVVKNFYSVFAWLVLGEGRIRKFCSLVFCGLDMKLIPGEFPQRVFTGLAEFETIII